MANFWFKLPTIDDEQIFARLEHLHPIAAIDAADITDVLKNGDICISTGENFSQFEELGNSILQVGGHLLLMPPFRSKQKHYVSDKYFEIALKPVALSQSFISDMKLKQASGLDEFKILFNQAFSTYPGTPAVLTSDKEAIVIRYRPRSNWGSIILTTFLLYSSSIRSSRAHREIFCNCLGKWLFEELNDKSQQKIKSQEHFYLQAIPEYPLVILAVACLRGEKELVEEDFQESYFHIQKQFGYSANLRVWDIRWLAEMERQNLITKMSNTTWIINTNSIEIEIERLHLTPYLRRLT